jgi:type VI secretion system secreted protein VgrG
MADPGSVKQGNVVAPTKPTAAKEAAKSSAGNIEQVQAGQFSTTPPKYGTQSVKAHVKNEENVDKTHWIEILLVDDAGQPVPGESVDIKCPDGSVATRSTDDKGLARVEYLDSGTCEITFTKLDKEAVEPA